MRVGGIFESRDGTFFENEFPMRGNVPSTSSEGAPHATDTFVPVEYTEQPTTESLKEENDGVARKSKRPRIAKSFGDDFAIYLVDDTPTTIKEAFLSHPDVKEHSGAKSHVRQDLKFTHMDRHHQWYKTQCSNELHK